MIAHMTCYFLENNRPLTLHSQARVLPSDSFFYPVSLLS